MNLLKVSGISIKYQSGIAVNNISFEVNRGDYCCIVGANGSGKSSLMKGILGLISISSGKVEYSIPKWETAYLSQINSIPLDFPATVKEIVMTGTQKPMRKFSPPFYNKSDFKSAVESMELLKISDCAKRRFEELSGGQRQRVLIARALCGNPQLMFLDEPCAGLDADISEDFYEIVSRLNREKNMAVLMISHDLEYVRKYAKSIIEMDEEILFRGTIKEWEKFNSH